MSVGMELFLQNTIPEIDISDPPCLHLHFVILHFRIAIEVIKWVLIYCKVKHIMRVSILCKVYPHARSFNVDLLNIFVMLQKTEKSKFSCMSFQLPLF